MSQNENLTTPDAVLGEIEKIHAVLSTARRMTGEGRTIDLSAVDQRIRHLCDGIARLPAEQGRPLAPALNALLGAFDALSKDLQDRFGSLPNLGDIASAKDAALVYGNTTKHFP